MKSGTNLRVPAIMLAVLMVIGALAGCSKTGTETVSDEMGRDSVSGAPTVAASEPLPAEGYAGDKAVQAAPTSEGTTADADRMIIRTQTLRLEVESTTDAVAALRNLASANSAVITDLQVATDTDGWLYRYDEYGYTVGDGAALRGWMTVRVPAESLTAFVDAAIELGTVKFQSEGSEDVTQQHVDLTARLTNLQAEEARLRSFFDAATNVEEMLLVEAELNRVRQEIESLDAQVKYLERQAAMATVTIELTEEKPAVRPEGDDWGFRDAITSGFRGAANVLTFAIAFLIATAPLWILGLIILFVVRAIIRSRRNRRAGAARAVEIPESPAEQIDE
jgi:hypothetical protein